MKLAPGTPSSRGFASLRGRFRQAVEEFLEERPLETPMGEVLEDQYEEQFGFRGGNHEPVECWVYRRNGTDLEMRFAFYSNFTPDDLICKVVSGGGTITQGEGASLQLNADRSVVERKDGTLVLQHHGQVTVGTSRSRPDLLRAIGQVTPEGLAQLGGLSWPHQIGTTENIEKLLDNLFLYAYCIEQAKRFFREQSRLPAL